MTTAARTLQLGRISLPAFDESDLENQLGSTLNPVGGAVPAGDRKPKGFTLNILVHGDPHDTNPYATGLLMRKQLQSLFQNHPYRSAPVYVQSSVDPELNGWYMLGEAALDWADGGSTFNEYTLKISQAYIVGRQATHRAGLIARIPTPGDCFLDTLQTVSSNPFPTTSYDTQPYIWLPPGATDVVGPDGTPATAIIGRPDGSNLYHDPNVNSELWAVSYELPESSVGLGDVVVYDRNRTTNTTGSALTAIPAGWQEVYGPDWRWSNSTDIPALCNGVCRVQWTGTGLQFAVDALTGSGWARQGNVTAFAGNPSADYAHQSVSLLEWTPERAVLKIIATADGGRVRVLVTLQRGWSAPRIEVYDLGTPTTPTIKWVMAGTAIPTVSTGTGWTEMDSGSQVVVLAVVQSSQAITSNTTGRYLQVAGGQYVSAHFETLLPTGYGSNVWGWALQDTRPLQTLVERGY